LRNVQDASDNLFLDIFNVEIDIFLKIEGIIVFNPRSAMLLFSRFSFLKNEYFFESNNGIKPLVPVGPILLLDKSIDWILSDKLVLIFNTAPPSKWLNDKLIE